MPLDDGPLEFPPVPPDSWRNYVETAMTIFSVSAVCLFLVWLVTEHHL